jgi:hypothetical protein
MLAEPPLIVRMRGLAGFIGNSFVIPQSKRNQFRASGAVIRVKNASNPIWTNIGVFDPVFNSLSVDSSGLSKVDHFLSFFLKRKQMSALPAFPYSPFKILKIADILRIASRTLKPQLRLGTQF